MPRLFTGLEVPQDIAFRLSLLRGGVSGAKWIEPDDYHLTLSFIGNVDEGIASDAADELSRIAGAQAFRPPHGAGLVRRREAAGYHRARGTDE